MERISGFPEIYLRRELTGRFSPDEKYEVITADNRRMLLRVSDEKSYVRKKEEFQLLSALGKLDLPTPRPHHLVLNPKDNRVYALFAWRDGEDAALTLPLLSDTEQYALGFQSGQILQKIHSISAPPELEAWEMRFARKIQTGIERYRTCGICFDGACHLIHYLENNMTLLNRRPQRLQHGDYHVANMAIDASGTLSIIDFDRFAFGDPWEEFACIAKSASISPFFATGQINGYFNGKPPRTFFPLLAFYQAANALFAIPSAVPYGQQEIDVSLRQAEDTLACFNQMKSSMPTWYQGEIYMQTIDGLPCRLKAPFDLTLFSRYGKAFKVFDDQDSGNLCLGVQKNSKRYFVKFAGAPTVRASDAPQQAIDRLKQALPLYADLRHPNLIRLLSIDEFEKGIAAVFVWENGVSMGRMYPEAHKRFNALPLETKEKIYVDILRFHQFVAEKGYVAIDFYDGSVLYDAETNKTVICDIDFYQKRPYVNRMGRLWGSSRFMSPEEYQFEAAIDEITNVYTMGAMAFELFSGGDRDRSTWPLDDARYKAAMQAVQGDRSLRQQSIRSLIAQWTTGKKKSMSD